MDRQEHSNQKDDDLFEPDPMVAPLVEHDKNHPQTFSVVLVAGWKFLGEKSSLFHDTYLQLRDHVRKCFDEIDVVNYPETKSSSSSLAASSVYCYPPEALHVTIASFHTIQQQPILSSNDQLKVIEYWKNIVIEASQQPNWPKKKHLELVVNDVQIRKRAGIILWEELSGGIVAMRQCIQDILHQGKELPKLDSAVNLSISDTVSIPNIIHSTFVRFYKSPTTNISTVNKRLQESVLPTFSSIQLDSNLAMLVVERMPYMHIPDDDHHVVLKCKVEA